MLGLVAIVTAPNGATADLSVVVHASLPHGLPDSADAQAATLEWCAGEVDESVIIGRGYTFTAVDIRLQPRDGDWPDRPEHLGAAHPEPRDRVDRLPSSATCGRWMPATTTRSETPCRTACSRQLLDGIGEGTLYLGIPNDISGVDAASFTAWTLHDFGVAAHLPGDLGESDVVFSSCTSALTPLGEEFGAPNDSWHENADPALCSVGGSTFSDARWLRSARRMASASRGARAG